MRLLFTAILGTILFSGHALAQEDNVATATDALQSVLSTLKESVEKLSLDNNQWTARDDAIRQMVLQLQMQLGNLESQGDALNNAANKLQDKNPRKAPLITRMEGENFDLDDRIQKAEGGIKLIQKSLDAGYQEDQKLLLQLKAIQNGLPLPSMIESPVSQADATRRKEKLKFLKMIADSQDRQEALHESILAVQKNAPLLPAANALARQQLLKEQIKDLESQMALYPASTPMGLGAADQWDNDQLRQLEVELKVLEQNYAQLKDLTEQMSKKVQSSRMTVSQHVEEEKLQSSIDDLNHKGEGLRADLEDLRSQMVDLDKRKSHLETMIQQTPA
jgi:chromosome segregation ATPase